jgi:hypothetical protein
MFLENIIFMLLINSKLLYSFFSCIKFFNFNHTLFYPPLFFLFSLSKIKTLEIGNNANFIMCKTQFNTIFFKMANFWYKHSFLQAKCFHFVYKQIFNVLNVIYYLALSQKKIGFFSTNSFKSDSFDLNCLNTFSLGFETFSQLNPYFSYTSNFFRNYQNWLVFSFALKINQISLLVFFSHPSTNFFLKMLRQLKIPTCALTSYQSKSFFDYSLCYLNNASYRPLLASLTGLIFFKTLLLAKNNKRLFLLNSVKKYL